MHSLIFTRSVIIYCVSTCCMFLCYCVYLWLWWRNNGNVSVVIAIRTGRLMVCRRGQWYITACDVVISTLQPPLSTRPDNISPTFHSFSRNMLTAVLEGIFKDPIAENIVLYGVAITFPVSVRLCEMIILCWLSISKHVYSGEKSYCSNCQSCSLDAKVSSVLNDIWVREQRHWGWVDVCCTCCWSLH